MDEHCKLLDDARDQILIRLTAIEACFRVDEQARNPPLVLDRRYHHSGQPQRRALKSTYSAGSDGNIGCGNDLAHVGIDQQADSA